MVRAGESKLSSFFVVLMFMLPNDFLGRSFCGGNFRTHREPILGASISDTMFHGPVYFLDTFKSTFSRDNGNSAPSMSAF